MSRIPHALGLLIHFALTLVIAMVLSMTLGDDLGSAMDFASDMIADYDWLALIIGRTTLIFGVLVLSYLFIRNAFLLTGYIYGAFRARRYGSINASWGRTIAIGWNHYIDGSYRGEWFERGGKSIPLFGFSRVRRSTLFPAFEDAPADGASL